MNKVPFFNDSKQRRVVGGQAVAPGATIYIDERDHPGLKPKAKAAPDHAPSDPVLKILDQSVPDIIPLLPGLSDEDFEKLQQGERDGKTRKSLGQAFEEERLRRAELKLGEGNADPDGEDDADPDGEGDADPDGEGDADPDGDADKVDE